MIKWDKPCYKCRSHFCDLSCKEPKHLQAPQRPWVGLTDEEIEAIGKDDKVLLAQFHTSVKAIDEMKDPTAQIMNLVIRQQGFNFAKAIEAKLREKNSC